MRHNHAPFIIAILLLVIIVAFTEECSGQTDEAGSLTYTSYGSPSPLFLGKNYEIRIGIHQTARHKVSE